MMQSYDGGQDPAKIQTEKWQKPFRKFYSRIQVEQ